MTSPDERAHTFEEVLEVIQLDGIGLNELYATSKNTEQRDDLPDGAITFEFRVRQSTDLTLMRVEIHSVAISGEVKLRCEHELQYSLSRPLGLDDEEVRQRFLNELVIFHATPYIRETLHTLANRLEVTPPQVPLLKATEVSRNPEGDEFPESGS